MWVLEVNHTIHPSQFADGTFSDGPQQGINVFNADEITGKLLQQHQCLQPQDLTSRMGLLMKRHGIHDRDTTRP